MNTVEVRTVKGAVLNGEGGLLRRTPLTVSEADAEALSTAGTAERIPEHEDVRLVAMIAPRISLPWKGAMLRGHVKLPALEALELCDEYPGMVSVSLPEKDVTSLTHPDGVDMRGSPTLASRGICASSVSSGARSTPYSAGCRSWRCPATPGR